MGPARCAAGTLPSLDRALLPRTKGWPANHCVQPSMSCVRQAKLAAVLAEKRKLGPEAARLFIEGLPGELVLPECTQLEEPDLAQLLSECAGPR